jgi:hypothetical protein
LEGDDAGGRVPAGSYDLPGNGADGHRRAPVYRVRCGDAVGTQPALFGQEKRAMNDLKRLFVRAIAFEQPSSS